MAPLAHLLSLVILAPALAAGGWDPAKERAGMALLASATNETESEALEVHGILPTWLHGNYYR